jgi:hypothetical protein
MYLSPINSFKERDKKHSVALCCDFPLRVWLIRYFGAALTQLGKDVNVSIL